MIDQYNTSSIQSPRDSFFSDPNAYHTRPIRPPRSNASCSRTLTSQKDAPKPATLTAEALDKLSNTDKNKASAYKITRIKDFLHRLPDPADPEDPSNSPPDTDLDILEAEFQTHHHYYYNDEEASTPFSPTAKVLKAPNTPRKARPQPNHPPLAPRDTHLHHCFRAMQSSESYAQFWHQRARLTLQYDNDKKVALLVGVDTKAHARRIHGHMLWLRDKWLGVRAGLFYHVMGFEDDEGGEEIKAKG